MKTTAQLLLLNLYGVAGEGTADGNQPIPFDEPDWGSLFDGDSEPDEEEKETPPAPVENPPEEEEAPAPEVPEPEEEPVEEDPAPSPAPEPEPAEETPTQPVEQPKQLTPEEEQAQFAKVMGELEAQYKLSQEEADMLNTEPEKVMPKLAARLEMQITRNMMQLFQQIQSQLPQAIEQTTREASKKKEASDAFTQRWPGLLDTKEGQQAAVAAAQLYRQQNPKATLKDVIENSGKLAYTILGKDVPTAPTQAKPAGKPKPHLPASTKPAGTKVNTQQKDPQADFFASLTQGF